MPSNEVTDLLKSLFPSQRLVDWVGALGSCSLPPFIDLKLTSAQKAPPVCLHPSLYSCGRIISVPNKLTVRLVALYTHPCTLRLVSLRCTQPNPMVSAPGSLPGNILFLGDNFSFKQGAFPDSCNTHTLLQKDS